MSHSGQSNSWRQARLKEVCREITVGHVGPMADEYVEQGIPFIRSQDIQPFRLDFSDLKHISLEFNLKLRKSAIGPGDVVVVRTGYPGTACVIPKRLAIANCADLVIIRPSWEIDPWYLASVFNSTWGRDTVAGKLVGVAQQHFNIGMAKEMVVKLPPIQTQRKIAGILSAYDDLIENNTRRIKILEEMARAIYGEWFVHFRFPGHEKVKIVSSPLGPIPQGWEVCNLAQLASVNALSVRRGEEPEEIEYIDISSVSTGSIDKTQPMRFEGAPSRARRIVRHGDIVWSTVRPNRRSYSLILNPRPNVIVSTGFAVISAREAPYTYLYHALTADDFVAYLTNHATGAAYPAVNAEDFENARIVRPSRFLLDQFHEIGQPMFELRDCLGQKNIKLRQTRDLLLPKLISGELDVSELDINVRENLP